MRASVAALATFLATVPSAIAGNVCLAEASICGPVGGCSRNYQIWGPGRDPCGDESQEMNDLDEQGLRICGDNGNIVSTGDGEFDIALEINGELYHPEEIESGSEPCSLGCDGIVRLFGRLYWPDTPICG